jgi:preprotein translocase subunit SecB|tara:strand:- start:87 stop:500 length:414 start_codon:yes stop_codon:yes gene_type:complete
MSYNIVAKYIKDINFKVPNAKSYFMIEKNIKNYKINFDIKSRKIKDDILEIDTDLKLVSQVSNENEIKVSVLFSTLVNFKKIITDKKELEKIILVDVPTTIYPDIRNILVFLFEKSGFKQISIDRSVDFKSLYEKNN